MSQAMTLSWQEEVLAAVASLPIEQRIVLLSVNLEAVMAPLSEPDRAVLLQGERLRIFLSILTYEPISSAYRYLRYCAGQSLLWGDLLNHN